MKTLISKIRVLLNKQKIRFLLVGGFNTVFGYLMFTAVNLVFGIALGYVICLVIAQIISASLAYKIYQNYVFSKESRGFKPYMRFQSAYALPLMINIFALPVLVELINLNIYLAQALFSSLWIVASFFVHKNYSFRK